MTYIAGIHTEINRKLGISPETFLKYDAEPKIDKQATPRANTFAALSLLHPTHQAINRQLGVSDDVFLNYATVS